MFYAVVRSKRTPAWQTLRSRPDILRLGVLHCCILGNIIFIMKTRFGRSSTDRSACAYNVRSGTYHLQQRRSFCMSALPCWKSVPKCIRIDLRASKIQKFPGGGMPPDPPSHCVLRGHHSGATLLATNLRLSWTTCKLLPPPRYTTTWTNVYCIACKSSLQSYVHTLLLSFTHSHTHTHTHTHSVSHCTWGMEISALWTRMETHTQQ